MTGDLSAALEPVRERQRLVTTPASWTSGERLGAVFEARRMLVREDVPRLLAALNAAAVPQDRELLGRLVRATWVDWALEQPDPKPSWLLTWSELDDGQREVDMRIGEAVATHFRAAITRALLGKENADGNS